jgi:hypothetical protein
MGAAGAFALGYDAVAGAGLFMRPLHENLAGRWLRWLADALHDHPIWFVYPQALLTLGCIGYVTGHLDFSARRSDLVSADVKYQRDFLTFKREFELQESMVAVVESGSTDKNRQFVERLVARLNGEAGLFKDIYYKGDLKLMGSKSLLFLPEATLEELRQALHKNLALIQTSFQATNLNALFEAVNRQFRSYSATEAADSAAESLTRTLPALQRVVNLAAETLAQPTVIPAPGIAALFGDARGADRPGLYLAFARGQIYAVVAHATSEHREEEAIARLRELVRQTQDEVPGVNAGITGERVLELDEMRQARHDTDVAAIVSLLLSGLIFVYGYHEIRRPLMATVSLLVGIAYTLGFATLTVGRLNILTITLVPILIGLAIDFGVHLIARYEEELRRGSNERMAIRKALTFTGIGIFSSGFTTAGAFFAMMLTDFKGIREMGLISGVGLLVCMVPMMTLLPLMLVRSKVGQPAPSSTTGKRGRRARFEQLYMKRPWAVLICGAAFTLFTLTQIPKLHFDYNLLNLQTRDLAAVGLEKKLIESGSQSLLYCVVIAESLPQAAELEEKIKRLPSVANVVSMSKYLTEDQSEKLRLIRAIKHDLDAIVIPGLDVSPVELSTLGRTLFSLQGYLGLAVEQIRSGRSESRLEPELSSLRDAVRQLRTVIASGGEETLARLTAFQQSLFGDLKEAVGVILQQDDREGLSVGDLPPFLRERFISRSGNFLLQVYPREDVWQRDQQERFVRELRTVDPNVTGTPVQFYEYTSMLKQSFQKAAGYAVAVIAFLVLLHFRRIGSVLVAFLPVALGFCWMLGLMAFFGISFNPVNIMALTLLIGIGVTNGIHILNRFAEEAQPSVLAQSTGKAVLVSALTTMAGFGSLMVADHQGIASLGQVMVIGTGMCLVASLAFLPAVLTILDRVGWSLITKKWRTGVDGSAGLSNGGRRHGREGD